MDDAAAVADLRRKGRAIEIEVPELGHALGPLARLHVFHSDLGSDLGEEGAEEGAGEEAAAAGG